MKISSSNFRPGIIIVIKEAFACILLVLSATPALGGHGSIRVDVSAPSDIAASVRFSDPRGGNTLEPGKAGKLLITLKNRGKGNATGLNAEIRTDRTVRGLRFDKQVNVGTVPGGKSVIKEVEVKAGEDLAGGEVKLEVVITDSHGSEADTARTTFRTRGAEQPKPPKLLVADYGINDSNGNFRIDPNEKIEVAVRIQNTGLGEARRVSADVNAGKNVVIEGGETHFNLGNIQPGKYKDFKFIFSASDRIKTGQMIPLEIDIGEERAQYKASGQLELEMNSRPKRAQDIIERD